MNVTALERLKQATAEKLCVACMEPLGDGVAIRGCHGKCHRATLRAIEAGTTTEAERVMEGKFLRKAKCGRKQSNPVTRELSF